MHSQSDDGKSIAMKYIIMTDVAFEMGWSRALRYCVRFYIHTVCVNFDFILCI